MPLMVLASGPEFRSILWWTRLMGLASGPDARSAGGPDLREALGGGQQATGGPYCETFAAAGEPRAAPAQPPPGGRQE
eukprot:12188654-Heterocapsa_arctica.AAC.1